MGIHTPEHEHTQQGGRGGGKRWSEEGCNFTINPNCHSNACRLRELIKRPTSISSWRRTSFSAIHFSVFPTTFERRISTCSATDLASPSSARSRQGQKSEVALCKRTERAGQIRAQSKHRRAAWVGGRKGCEWLRKRRTSDKAQWSPDSSLKGRNKSPAPPARGVFSQPYHPVYLQKAPQGAIALEREEGGQE